MVDKAFLKEFLLKPLCYAVIFLLAVYILNTFTDINFSLTSNSQNNSFEVTGTGKVTAVPNIAQTNFNITEKGKTQEEAKNAANAKQNSAIEVLTSLGVKKEHIKTEGFYVNPNYEDVTVQPFAGGSSGVSTQFVPAQRTPNGYVANVSTTVKSEKVEVLNQAIDKLTALGINVGGVTYSFDDQESYKAQARVKAIEDARKKADELAKTAGFRVGRLISIREDQGGGVYPYAAMKATAPETRDTTTDLQPGENEISTSVTITYSIK